LLSTAVPGIDSIKTHIFGGSIAGMRVFLWQNSIILSLSRYMHITCRVFRRKMVGEIVDISFGGKFDCQYGKKIKFLMVKLFIISQQNHGTPSYI